MKGWPEIYLAVLVGVTAAAPAAHAQDACKYYTYKAHVTAVYDGDTITADIDLGFHVSVRHEKLRLYGIDAPELRARKGHPLAQGERAKAIEARDALRQLIRDKDVSLCTIKDKQGKYGRYLAQITTLEGLDVNAWLVKQGFATPYMLKSAAIN